MKRIHCGALLLFLTSAPLAQAPTPSKTGADTFAEAAAALQHQLEQSVAELDGLRAQIAAEKVPLARRLAQLEAELVQARLDAQKASLLLDSRTLDLSNLSGEIRARQEESAYLATLLSEYIRNFEARLHIAEIQRYEEQLARAKLAQDNSALSPREIQRAQAEMLDVSLARLHEALGGARFEGTAVDAAGLVKQGTFVRVGPAVIFRAADGATIGTAEQRMGSLEPTVVGFDDPLDAAAAEQVVLASSGSFPLDPTLGDAHKMESTRETLWEHIQRGGPVMVPIFALAGAALLVVLYKWLSLTLVRKPSQRRIDALVECLSRGDERAAAQQAQAMGGPTGKMLAAGVEHLGEPRELIEEVMYETVLATRLRLQRLLPFVAISASSAPLLGLLGTVTGIMNTFKLITVFGTGDVKTLSSGISEALITTEYGLIVAIPSLLLHALLARKARGVVDQMERAAIAFLNQVGKTPFPRATPEPLPTPEALGLALAGEAARPGTDGQGGGRRGVVAQGAFPKGKDEA